MSASAEWVPSLWIETFQDLVEDELDYEDQWTYNFNYSLTDSLTSGQIRRGWKVCCQYIFGRFQCSSCSKNWNSAKVTVWFHYRLQSRTSRGTVLMRPFGQMCRSCSSPIYHLPGFSEEVVERTLLKMISKIKKNCYGDYDGVYDCECELPNKRFSKPHEKALCEACALGICCQDSD